MHIKHAKFWFGVQFPLKESINLNSPHPLVLPGCINGWIPLLYCADYLLNDPPRCSSKVVSGSVITRSCVLDSRRATVPYQ